MTGQWHHIVLKETAPVVRRQNDVERFLASITFATHMMPYGEHSDIQVLLTRLTHLDARTNKDLLRLLGSDSPEVVRVSAWLCGLLRYRRASKKLLQVLANEDYRDDVRIEAARALGKMSNEFCARALMGALDSVPSPLVRDAVILALGITGSISALASLARIFRDDSERVEARVNAVCGLAGIGDARLTTVVIAGLSDPSVAIRFWSAWALGRFGSVAALSTLSVTARSDNEVCAGYWTVAEEASVAIELIEARTSLASP